MKSDPKQAKPRCGLCGKTAKLMRTSCCDNWICDDQEDYVLFSFARNSCARNHDRYTLCAFHWHNEHPGHWQDCRLCREELGTEMYVWYGTNEYNFEKLKNPPHFEPTRCDQCGVVIKLGTDGYSTGPAGTLCERCTHPGPDFALARPRPRSRRKRPVARKVTAKLPVNEDPRAMEIIVSARVQQRWRLQPAVRTGESPAHWLARWRMDFAQSADRTWLALVTNVATLYTFVFPLKKLTPAGFEELFRLRLGFALTDAPALAAWRTAPLVFAAGNPRAAVGSMNRMIMELRWNTDRDGFQRIDDEDWVNDGICLSLEDVYPRKSFERQLAAAAVSG